MDIFAAASLLQDKLRGHPWLAAVAVGGLDEKEVIFVYTKRHIHNKDLESLQRDGWMGFDVKIERVGHAAPAVT